MPRERLSLKARALGWLAQREHSRAELRRKLLRVARQELAERGGPSDPAGACEDPATCVERLLDWLQVHGYLDETRFVESRIHARAARYGNLRIRQELAQHGLAAEGEQLDALKASELDRARAVWQRKFGSPTTDPKERARQMRFLAQRGFSGEVVRRVVHAGDDD